jgi:DNA-binding transcriptional LysR family regulator
MEIRHLKTFVAVAEELSFTRAAKRLNLSQPPVSLQIRELEEELGAKLFERGGQRRISLTPAGKVLLDGARQTLLALERAKQNTRAAMLGHFGTLDIGYTDDFSFGILPRALAEFRREYRAVNIALHMRPSLQLLERVSEGEYDLAFLCLPIPQSMRDLSVRRLPPTEIVAVVSSNHRLAKRKRIWVRELADTPLHLVPHQLVSGFSVQVTRLLAGARISPIVHTTCDNTMLQLQMAALGAGATLASLTAIPENWSEISILRFRDEPVPLELGMIHRQDARNQALIDAFTSCLG